ncbi:MAG: Ig-like domain-containing protein, partial [Pseudobutyrivibrio sp.]|nr:Ig-like domain-containing protein [Pseudobutyrivibrio sp.]
MKRVKIGKSIIAFGLLLGLLLAPVTSVYAEESENEGAVEGKIDTHVELDIKQNPQDADGKNVIITASVYSIDGDKIDVSDASNGQVTIYYKQTTNSKYNSNKKTSWSINVSEGKSYNIYAEYIGTDKYEESKSEVETIDVIKYTSLKGYLKTTKNLASETYGIYVDESYPDYNLINKLAYRLGSGVTNTVAGTSFSVSEEGTYYVGVPQKQEGNTFYLFSGNTSIAVSDNAPVTYSILAQADERVTWTRSSFYNVTSGNYTTYAHINEANKNDYYIKDVEAEPAENADVSYNQGTGEVAISNVTGNVSLKAIVGQKASVASLEIQDISVSTNQNYSEDNAFVQFSIQVKALDANKNVIPGTKIYFKNDAKDVSFTNASTTDSNGIATFVYSYGIQLGEISADYHPVFALTSDFSNILLEDDIHFVLQKKKDLELYEDQIIGTKPGENTGKVINVPDNYEIWTGEVHQGALVVGSGNWVRPVNGEFTGLSAGQHIIRFGEKFDKVTNTFYFASNYADFFVPRGIYELVVNETE